MARCDVCMQEMKTADSCLDNRLRAAGRDYKRIPFTKERDFLLGGSLFKIEVWHCADCGVGPGGIHHPGCDIEECPKCHGQLLSCECFETV